MNFTWNCHLTLMWNSLQVNFEQMHLYSTWILFKRHHFRHYKNENAHFRIDSVIMNSTQLYNVYGNYILQQIFLVTFFQFWVAAATWLLLTDTDKAFSWKWEENIQTRTYWWKFNQSLKGHRIRLNRISPKLNKTCMKHFFFKWSIFSSLYPLPHGHRLISWLHLMLYIGIRFKLCLNIHKIMLMFRVEFHLNL